MMLRRNGFVAIVLAIIATAACGGSDDTASDQPQEDTAPIGNAGTGNGDGAEGSTGDADGGDGQAGEPAEATPPVVGSTVAGIAVATVSGTPDVPEEQSGDVTRVGQDCTGRGAMEGLAAGAVVTILDGSSGEPVGTGEVAHTSAVEISDGSDGSPPRWECSFHIIATLSSAPASIRIQVGDLEPWDVQGSIDDFVTTVPGSGDATVDTTPPAGSSAPSVDTSLPSSDTSPATESLLTTPSS